MTETIIGAIVGGSISLAILIIKEVSDFIKTDKLFKQSQRKEFFIKKLNAFEKAAAYYTIAHSSISNMAAIFKAGISEDVYLSGEEAAKAISLIQKNIDDVNKVTQDTALAIGIYTDYDFSDEDENFAEQFFKKLGEINQIGFEINIVNSVSERESGNQEIQDRSEKRVDALLKSMELKILELEALSKKVKEKYKAVTKTLRNELKKYDK